MYYPKQIIKKNFNMPATIRNTGITVYSIVKSGISGLEPEDILREHKNLTMEDFEAAMIYAFSNAKEIERNILENK